MSKTANCPRHGEQGIGLVCSHIAQAVDTGEAVGFFWSDDADTARPDAWCAACEEELKALNGAASDSWFIAAGFKILCAACWDEARRVLHDRFHHGLA